MGLGHGVVEILEPCSCLSTQLQSSLPSLAMGKQGRIEWEGRDGRMRARIGASSKSWKVDEHGADGGIEACARVAARTRLGLGYWEANGCSC